MALTYYLDEDLSDEIAVIAQGLGVDAISSHAVGNNGFSDEDQLRLAGRDGRCFVAKNRDDLVELTLAFAERGEFHAGLLIVPRLVPRYRFAAAAHALAAFARNNPDGLQPYQIAYLHF